MSISKLEAWTESEADNCCLDFSLILAGFSLPCSFYSCPSSVPSGLLSLAINREASTSYWRFYQLPDSSLIEPWMIPLNNLSLLCCCWAAVDGGNSTVASRTEEQNELDKLQRTRPDVVLFSLVVGMEFYKLQITLVNLLSVRFCH